MKMKYKVVLCSLLTMLLVDPVCGQGIRITAFGQEGLAMGALTKKDISDNGAGYVDYSSAAGLEFNYYLANKLGFGWRWSATYYTRDIDSYESDLTTMLGITNQAYDMTLSYAFWSVGSDLGISYLVDMSAKWQLEPYFYVGLQLMQSPMSSAIYLQNNTTYQYRSKPQLYVGFRYAPGAKVHWNAFRRAGIYLSLEYAGNSFIGEDERSMIYSHNTLEITDTEKNYSVGSLYLGLGLAVRFGKGFQE